MAVDWEDAATMQKFAGLLRKHGLVGQDLPFQDLLMVANYAQQLAIRIDRMPSLDGQDHTDLLTFAETLAATSLILLVTRAVE